MMIIPEKEINKSKEINNPILIKELITSKVDATNSIRMVEIEICLINLIGSRKSKIAFSKDWKLIIFENAEIAKTLERQIWKIKCNIYWFL